jgi:glutaredoxin 3
MPDVVVYTSDTCPYCVRAKALLDRKGVSYTEINVQTSPGKKEEMMKKSGGRTSVPQIFVGDVHVGGCDDLYAREKEGTLDALLAA